MTAPASASSATFESGEAFALQLDALDPLASFRDRFHIPVDDAGKPRIYFCGNSLGLMPKMAGAFVQQELADWARLGVDGHFDGRTPWYSYHEVFREKLGRLVGAQPNEVVVMNSLTVNLHLMMVSFYRPTKQRYKILMEAPAFPSDRYAVTSQIRCHRFEPNDALVIVGPREGEQTVRMGDIESILEDHGDQIALVLLAGVNYFTGQVLDMRRIAAHAKREGCTLGLDLAHAVGNVPIALHDWGVDFAVWCHYKYMNAGPGAVAGCFVHERHATRADADLPRLTGWWGNDPATRFRMHLEPDFKPVASVDSWQVSNPPIFSLAPLRASLDIFDEAGMDRLRAKSELLTGYLQFLMDRMPSNRYVVITPKRASERGCQFSILVNENPRELFKELEEAGVKADFREPNVIRVAPVPLYNTFHEVWRFAEMLGR